MAALRRLQALVRHVVEPTPSFIQAASLSSTPTASASHPVACIMGAGDATGSALARRFAAGGYTVCVARRNADKLEALTEEIEGSGGRCLAFGVDARDEEAVVSFVRQVEAEVGPVEVAVHNIGANVFFGIHDTTSRVYRKVWEMAALSAFLFGREVTRGMRDRGSGTMIFTGATASTRGAKGFAAFAGAMAAKRALAQSMARELGPEGVHVAHVVIDGPIDTAFVAEIVGMEAFVRLKEAGGLLDPAAIAEQYFQLVQQPPTAWTHECDLRPAIERW